VGDLGQPASEALFESGAAQPRPPRPGSVFEPRDAARLQRWIQRRTVEGSWPKRSAMVGAG